MCFPGKARTSNLRIDFQVPGAGPQKSRQRCGIPGCVARLPEIDDSLFHEFLLVIPVGRIIPDQISMD
jgi:hypothetical protein